MVTAARSQPKPDIHAAAERVLRFCAAAADGAARQADELHIGGAAVRLSDLRALAGCWHNEWATGEWAAATASGFAFDYAEGRRVLDLTDLALHVINSTAPRAEGRLPSGYEAALSQAQSRYRTAEAWSDRAAAGAAREHYDMVRYQWQGVARGIKRLEAIEAELGAWEPADSESTALRAAMQAELTAALDVLRAEHAQGRPRRPTGAAYRAMVMAQAGEDIAREAADVEAARAQWTAGCARQRRLLDALPERAPVRTG